MPYPLQKSPRGLLELMRLRTLGEQPRLFSEQVMPVIESNPFYGADLLQVLSPTANVGAILNLASTQTMLNASGLRGLGAFLTIGAAPATNVTLMWSVVIGDPTGATEASLGSQFIAQAPATAALFCGLPLPLLVLPPGTLCRCRVVGTAAGADHALRVTVLFEDYTPA